MASIVSRPNGHKWIQFRVPGGKRQTIRLGLVTQRQAQQFQFRVESLVSSYALGQAPQTDTAAWLGALPDRLYSVLAATGLANTRGPQTLKWLLEQFKAGLSVGASTKRNIEIVLDNLTSYFGEDHRISSINEAKARGFRAWLEQPEGRGLGRTTVSRRMRRVRQVFNLAVRSKWLDSNPFEKCSGGNEVNRTRDYFVTRETTAKILEKVDDPQFRLAIVLARYGGLRCPSELIPLLWEHVDLARGTILVTSTKTTRYEWRDVRTVPLFPEIRAAIQDLERPPDGGSLLPGIQISGAALRHRLEAACRRAGIPLWPKPWQNMRASRVTELLEEYPIHISASWLGHSAKVAIQHYAQIVKEHHARATGMGEQRASDLQPHPK